MGLALAVTMNAQTKKVATKTATKPQTGYASVKIGEQEWMSKNLDVSTFSNGDPIPRAQSNAEWEKAFAQHTPAWCYYIVGYSKEKYYGNPEKNKKYGKLYNWYAVNDERGLAPKDWIIPSYDDFMQLLNFLEPEYDDYGNAIQALKSSSGWYNEYSYNNTNLNGTNTSGFNAYPGGYRNGVKGGSDKFSYIGSMMKFWMKGTDGKACSLSNGGDGRDYPFKAVISCKYNEADGLSVRCVKGFNKTIQNYFDDGMERSNSGDYSGAIKNFDKGLSINSNDVNIIYHRGMANYKLNNIDAAIDDFKSISSFQTDRDNDNDIKLKHLAIYNLGYLNQKIGNFEEACNWFLEEVKDGNIQAKQGMKECNCKKLYGLGTE